MLAAMMGTQATTYGTSVNLITASPWTVPAGPTTIYINAATNGLSAYYVDTAIGSYVGGGGGGSAIINAPIAVSAGQVLTLTTIAATSGAGVRYRVQRSAVTLFTIEAPQSGNLSGNTLAAYGGKGGSVEWDLTSQTANPGAAGDASGTKNGGDGERVLLTGGGIILSGGGGGAGGTVSPFSAGGDGGSTPSESGFAAASGFGGGGAGFFPGGGQLTLSPSPTYQPAGYPVASGSTYITVNY
jgi:hypothetical protein